MEKELFKITITRMSVYIYEHHNLMRKKVEYIKLGMQSFDLNCRFLPNFAMNMENQLVHIDEINKYNLPPEKRARALILNSISSNSNFR